MQWNEAQWKPVCLYKKKNGREVPLDVKKMVEEIKYPVKGLGKHEEIFQKVQQKDNKTSVENKRWEII